jgi:pyruvate dehydrogenase E1 component alpha subunit
LRYVAVILDEGGHLPAKLETARKLEIVKDQLPLDQLLSLYQDMLLIRRFEERCTQLYGMGLIAGFCHLYIGQEAVVVGMQSVLSPQDSVVTAYRDHGHMLACGMDPKGVMAELTGRQGGYSKGKGGSMHMFSKEKNFFGGHGIVGAQVPIGTGLAFAHKYKNDGGLCATYLGDGAANQGQVYESFNMASLWKLPVIYIIENNQYGMGTSVERHAATGRLHVRGEPYGIPGHIVDGMDIEAVRKAGAMAVEHVRSGKGPILLEMKTYRYRGHSMSDPAKYRSKEEVEEVKAQNDPIDRFKAFLEKKHHVSDDAFKTIENDIKKVIKEVVDFAQNSPEPDPDELYTDILKESVSSPSAVSSITW